jgi:2-polyprenyl-3-methyl-5-hydroxy-6-metoxy-1,4-benzoquinol methylase
MDLFQRKENRNKLFNQNNSLKEDIERIFSEYSITDGKVILDIGCADIRDYSDSLIRRAGSYYGVDISSRDIITARGKLNTRPNCYLIQSSIEELDLPEGFFDIIVCNNMLAYTNQEVTINKIFSLLKPGGICISFYNNTWQYSVFKIFYPFKPFLKELVHSIVVLINSIIFYISGIKVFHTIFDTKKVLKRLILNHNPSSVIIKTDCDLLPYSVINFVFVK